MAKTDVVFNVSMDDTQLIQHALSGKASLDELKLASEKLDAALKQAGKGGDNFGQSVARAKREMDKMRMTFDPLYAASKRYEAAVERVDAAHAKGAINAAQYQDMLQGLSNKYLSVGTGANVFAGKMGLLGNLSDGTRSKIQQVGFQVQDFAVQVGSGTSATQAFAQQFPQLAGAFGPVGAAIGTLAAIGIPLLAVAFSDAAAESEKLSAEAERQKTAIDGLTEATSKLRLERQMADTGVQLEDEQTAMNEINRLMKEREEIQARITSLTSTDNVVASQGAVLNQAKYLNDSQETLQVKLDTLDATLKALQYERDIDIAARRRANEQRQAYIEQKKALEEVKGYIAAVFNTAQDLESVIKNMATIDLAKVFRDADAAAGGLLTRAGDALNTMVQMAQAQAALDARSIANTPGNVALGKYGSRGGSSSHAITDGFGQPITDSSSGGGGGGGKSNPLQAQLEALQNSLMTQEQAELDSYARRQETLTAALEQKMITLEQYNAMFEQLQQEHSDKMAGIDAFRYGDGLQKAGAFLGDMASALQGGNERMQKIAQKFAAAEALINAWRGFSQVLADPTLPWWAKIPQATAHLAAGMKAVSALGGSGGGGGGGARAASASAPAAASGGGGQYLNFQFNGGWTSTEDMGRFMVKAINQAVENGAQIRGARIV